MSDLRTAAQQALEFLDAEFGWSPGEAPRIDALRAALAQQAEPAQEPVAWIDALKDAFFEGFTSVATYNDTLLNSPEEAWENYKPPRAAPPQRKPLTEEEIDKIFKHLCNTVGASCKTMACAVERAHGIKE